MNSDIDSTEELKEQNEKLKEEKGKLEDQLTTYRIAFDKAEKLADFRKNYIDELKDERDRVKKDLFKTSIDLDKKMDLLKGAYTGIERQKKIIDRKEREIQGYMAGLKDVWAGKKQVIRTKFGSYVFGTIREDEKGDDTKYGMLGNPLKTQVRFSQVGGCKDAKDKLADIIDDIVDEQGVMDHGYELIKGILLSGPPGTGKTYLAKAFANEVGIESKQDVEFYLITKDMFTSKFVNESANSLSMIFDDAMGRVKKGKRVFLFFDEFESIASNRAGRADGGKEDEKVVTTFNEKLDGIKDTKGLHIFVATNRSDLLDSAVIRAGRIDLSVRVNRPNYEDRKEIFQIYVDEKLEKAKEYTANVDYDCISQASEGMTGADIKEMVNYVARTNRKLERKEGLKHRSITTGKLLDAIEYRKKNAVSENSLEERKSIGFECYDTSK